MKQPIKVAVTGAAGNIGYALVFRIASGQVFGPDQPVILSLIEIPQGMAALHGVVMELEDCAFPLLAGVEVNDDVNKGMHNVNWAVFVGAVPRKQGMERSDLLKINGKIFTLQGKALNEHAASDVRALVVGNPCNTNCYILMNNAKDVPNDRFFAMTMLDQNRSTAQLAIKAGISVSAVKNMIVWGNHSSTQYPDYLNAKINGKPATSVINDDAWFTNYFLPTVQKRGAAIIEARGLSSAASAANAIINSLQALTTNTPAGDTYSMCVCSQGQYGVDEGLIFSMPCRTENGKVIVQEGIVHNEFGQEKLKLTLEELRSERENVSDLVLAE